MTDMFHLGWFLNFVADEWNGNWGDGGRDFTGDFYVEMAKDLERAKFDYVLIEDKLMVSTAYGGTMEHDLKHGVNPKHDPVPLAVLMANATARLGVLPTMRPISSPPFLLARLCSTIDHIARGRFGWNVVTSGEDRSAQNFGLDKLWEHDERYVRASEYMELVSKLWESWEPDAIERDYMTGTYANFKKVHTIDFEGKYFKSRGPLNTAPSPQYRPTIAQAGASPPGRELAAQHADTIVAPANGVEAMTSMPGLGPTVAIPRTASCSTSSPRSSPTRTKRRWPSRSGGSPTRSTSSTCWPRSPPSPRSTSPSSISTSRCRRTCRRTASAVPWRASWPGARVRRCAR